MHATTCIGLQDWVPAIIEQHKPRSWQPHSDPHITELDKLLDILDDLATYPKRPEDNAAEEDKRKWREACRALDKKASILWQHAAQAIDDICTGILGLTGDPFVSDYVPMTAVDTDWDHIGE